MQERRAAMYFVDGPAATRRKPLFYSIFHAARERYARHIVRRADDCRDRTHYARAASLYRRAIAINPRRPDIRVQLAHMLKELSCFQEAEASYRQALALAPEDGDIHLQLGHLLKLLGRQDEAIAAYRTARLLLPGNSVAAAELEGLGAGSQEEKANSRQSAIETCIRKGDRLRDAHRPAEAAKAYGEALAAAPELTDIRIQYGNMLKDSGRATEAEAAYRGALSQCPDNPEIYLQLGHALKLQGRRDEATAAYRRAVFIEPSLDPAWTELLNLSGARDRNLLETKLAKGGVDALLGVTEELERLVRGVARLKEVLPSLLAQQAFPLAAYDRFRSIYDVPPPPQISQKPKFAILVSAVGLELQALHLVIASIAAQQYDNWQLYVVGDDDRHRRIVERLSRSDRRIGWASVSADASTWVAERRLALVAGADWLLFLEPSTVLHKHALGWFGAAIEQTHAKAFVSDAEQVRYSDMDNRQWTTPRLRHVVDYDTLLEFNPYGETVLVEVAAYQGVANSLVLDSVTVARHSLLLNLVERGTIGHLPLPIVARLQFGQQDASDADDADVRIDTILHHGPKRSPSLRLVNQPPDRRIDVIVPTRDNARDLQDFIASLGAQADEGTDLHVIILDNGSQKTETATTLNQLSRSPSVDVLRVDEPFNWSRLNNLGAAHSRADLLVFANDDMLMLSEGWDSHLRTLLERTDVGAVGARLLYPNESLQHGGIILGTADIDAHDGRYEPASNPGPCGRWHVTRAVSAVTGAFLAVQRQLFEAVGGFDEINLPVAYSDIDFALKVRARGQKILWTPKITLRHFESKTRGFDHLDPEKDARRRAERMFMRQRWGAALDSDPTINPAWHLSTTPFRLLSAPSEAHVWRHIRLCASANPWFPTTSNDLSGAAAAVGGA